MRPVTHNNTRTRTHQCIHDWTRAFSPRADMHTQIIVHTGERHQHKVGRSRVNLLCSWSGWVDVAACLCERILMCVYLSCYMCIMLLGTLVCTLGCDVSLLHSQMEFLQPSVHFFFPCLFLFLLFFFFTSSIKQTVVDRLQTQSLCYVSHLWRSVSLNVGRRLKQKETPIFKKWTMMKTKTWSSAAI